MKTTPERREDARQIEAGRRVMREIRQREIDDGETRLRALMEGTKDDSTQR